MAEKFLVREVADIKNFAGHIILNSITDLLNIVKPEDIVMRDEGDDNAYVEVELKVGGHEVKFSEFAKVLEDQFDKIVREKALEILKEESFSKVIRETEKLSSMVEKLARDAANELDVEYEDLY